MEYYNNHYLMEDEVRQILEGKTCPFYADCYDLMQYSGRSLQFVRIEPKSVVKPIYIAFRDTEFLPELAKALLLKPDEEIDLIPIYLNSLEQAKPNVNVMVCDEVKELKEDPGMANQIETVMSIAESCSRGQDDPVDLAFYPDHAPRSIYWEVFNLRKKHCVYNGGIIWHENQNKWSVHT